MKLELAFTECSTMRIHMVGIKGVGMTALAEILHARGALLSGSDTPEIFFTDAILSALHIPVVQEFSENNISKDIQYVVYSAAYSAQTNPELIKALQLNIPILSYPEALGLLSKTMKSAGIAGVHGKTTTTAMTGVCLRALETPATILVGSAVPDFNNRATSIQGDRFFVAETCEYRRHFLSFSPSYIVLTSIEADHLDYYSGYDDIFEAFYSYCSSLPPNGVLIYCADDPGAAALKEKLAAVRGDIACIPYGFTAEGAYRITSTSRDEGIQTFSIAGMKEPFCVSLPGMHMILDAVAAIAVSRTIALDDGKKMSDEQMRIMAKALCQFRSTKRRSEIIGEAQGILFMDDYAHHPSAIAATLAGLRDFYPSKRIIVDFMSHTYSRTHYLLKEFSSSFPDADMVILHKIYASAREKKGSEISGEDLFFETKKHHDNVHYFEEVMDAQEFLLNTLTQGDLFITMGAGDNWHLSHDLFATINSGAAGKERNNTV
ncbi:MAG: UDP-N-acetylmuramate--L-alanine ligase [Spirochaetales bacterium]|nr:UDP-N-acetylmuramate--L-alanine ligase [Spirochaetales bacterium]